MPAPCSPVPAARPGSAARVVRAAVFVCACALAAPAFDRAADVNLTASEGFGARHHGMALLRAGFAQGADAVVNAPASMNDVDDFTFMAAHTERFGLARFDNAALLIPLDARSTLGLAVATYAVSDVELHLTNTPAAPDGYFNTSDWMVTGSFAKRYGPAGAALDIGGSLHLLRRQLDQSGLGMRGDAMVQYTHDNRLRAGAYVRSLVPSTAAWSEGHTEYELPEAALFVAMRKPIPYFYGTLEAGFETPGLFQRGARSASRLEGERGITGPVSALKTSKIGAEFNFDFGLSLRAGFDELAPSSWASSARLGMGYTWRRIVALDYAFAAHPYLDESHRVALRFTPAFPQFEGRNFRPGRPARVTVPADRLRPTYPVDPYETEYDPEAGEILELPASPAPAPAPPVPASPPASAPAPAAPAEREVPEVLEELEEGEFLEP
ncbi:MAG TPA: hypothetical protein VKZ88_00420 [Fibrobacteria bacterium]|nr:hypothetical protein [Fibrobacteria bacterium]